MTNVDQSETNGITLLPCPFCGAEPEPINGGKYMFFDHDDACHFEMLIRSRSMTRSVKMAPDEIEAWNTRAERTCSWTGTVGCGLANGPYDEEEDACISFAVVKHFLDCGHYSITESTSPPNYCPNCGAKVVDE